MSGGVSGEMQTALETILDRVAPEHALALRWFVRHEGEVGPRPWRRGGRSIIEGLTIPLVAQRGIHQPSGWSVALSVTATATSVYLDGQPVSVDAETWVLPYRAHAGSQGSGSGSRWNRALSENQRTRTPVGVFVPAARDYRNLGLAMVESYDSGSDTFLLRGPVRMQQPAQTWEYPSQDDEQLLLSMAGREEADEWAATLVRRRRDQSAFRERLLAAYSGRCAVTDYHALDALQGAHILAYSGRSSQSVDNGLLLRADIHLLFDRHLVSIEPSERRMWLADPLKSTEYAPLNGRLLTLPGNPAQQPSQEKLGVHWAVFRGDVA